MANIAVSLWRVSELCLQLDDLGTKLAITEGA